MIIEIKMQLDVIQHTTAQNHLLKFHTLQFYSKGARETIFFEVKISARPRRSAEVIRWSDFLISGLR